MRVLKHTISLVFFLYDMIEESMDMRCVIYFLPFNFKKYLKFLASTTQ
jgi:hypothetical protein